MSIRSLLAWKFSGVLIPFFIGMGYAAMTYHQFAMAYILAALGSLWTLGYYVYSEGRNKRAAKVAKLANAARKHIAAGKVISNYRRALRWHSCREIGTYAGILLASGAFMFWLYLGQESYELGLLEGKLYPAGDQTPPTYCKTIEDTDVIVFLGSNAAVFKTFPHTVLKVKGTEILVVKRGADGALAITLKVFSSDGRIIASITDGQFVVNQNNILTMRRKDRSSLQVVDQYETQVLNVRYSNRQVVVIDAVLHHPGVSRPIILDGSHATSRGILGGVYANCIRNNGGADIEIP